MRETRISVFFVIGFLVLFLVMMTGRLVLSFSFIVPLVLFITIGVFMARGMSRVQSEKVELKICDKCGEKLDPYSRFCKHCGTKVSDKIICEYCGHENSDELLQCENCNALLK